MPRRKIRKGARVCTSGKGRTKNWPKDCGTVTRKRGNSVFVLWDRARFTEDEMSRGEVRLIEGRRKPKQRGIFVRKLSKIEMPRRR